MPGFVKTQEEINNMKMKDTFYNSPCTLLMAWEADKDAFRRILPPDLEMDDPIVNAGFVYYDKPGFGFPEYTLGTLSLNCRYKDVAGAYVLAMPIEGSDMGVFRCTAIPKSARMSA